MAAIAQAEIAARAAVDWAREVAYDDSLGNAPSRIGENGPGEFKAFPEEDSTLDITVDDAQGKFNLNTLVTQGKPSARDIIMFKRLLTQLKLPNELADAVVDWMDEDDLPLPGGAESAYYLQLKVPYRAANRQLSHLGELAMVKGYTPEVLKELSPYVTVLPGRALVNVNTAVAPVLIAVFNGMPLNAAESLIASRKSARFTSVANLRERLPKIVTGVVDTDFVVESKYFTVSVISSFKHAKIRAEALLGLGEKNYWPLVLWYKVT